MFTQTFSEELNAQLFELRMSTRCKKLRTVFYGDEKSAA